MPHRRPASLVLGHPLRRGTQSNPAAERQEDRVRVQIRDAPRTSKSMHSAVESLQLEKLLVVYPGEACYPSLKKSRFYRFRRRCRSLRLLECVKKTRVDKNGRSDQAEGIRSRIGSFWKFQIPACSVPDPQDGEHHRVVVNFIDDPVGADDEFPEKVLPIFRHDSTNPRKCLEGIDFGHDQITKTFCNLPVIPRDVADKVAQVDKRGLRPDYSVSHPSRRLRTSSCGTNSPRRTSSRDFSIAARKWMRSSISCQEVFSGSPLMVSMASSLVDMRGT